MTAEAEVFYDFKGLQCPLPVLKTRKKLQDLSAGDRIRIETTDPLSPLDIAHFCQSEGHILLEQQNEGRVFHFLIQKG
ncbi:sulfurtransferase TusA family protein [Pseudochrobactrum sp. Wa41.01b-1]|uniref:tRNA 2-thiouridine synthesizing protein A n=1 Tax=Pseudochrobactrum saccharolyticum TaxID=354352 RepID=A0A7W8AJM4_9HYPH|nr:MULTISPECIES: sulfurtransferase TusA family protein [Pseudochrobactrum]MBX8784410.1 sulfurtransferase TusA family protein [Ochrobactrum sp. GRS2]KAB0540879.1 sulfurtransferase TusA family protein [Pseudochrobactrum saccharolyticum]MBB5090476.1 tRNA 2-thiouridine synthesizing protein A [Pseudochrobactrum saccharolyticum]QYM71855.1 sulfurtransferase TusA family protein [Pseudochrobactrum sp. Wa41.01b-1]UCA45567.1 sulfurtransferase TusA family protein [Pseudochrobactrum sp. XF203]